MRRGSSGGGVQGWRGREWTWWRRLGRIQGGTPSSVTCLPESVSPTGLLSAGVPPPAAKTLHYPNRSPDRILNFLSADSGPSEGSSSSCEIYGALGTHLRDEPLEKLTHIPWSVRKGARWSVRVEWIPRLPRMNFTTLFPLHAHESFMQPTSNYP